MNRRSDILIGTGALLAALAVMLGAFGAHAVSDMVSPERLDNWEIAAEYHFYHSLGLILVGLLIRSRSSGKLKWAGYLFPVGILFFSGSLYLLVLLDLSILGAITPIGGLCFIAAWLLVAWEYLSSSQE